MDLFTYKLTHDTGFAPNPFGHTLTLATCKPSIRLNKLPGQWIAGFTSKTLTGEPVGSERLVYLMRIGEKLLLRDYFTDPRFRDKIPRNDSDDPVNQVGDNIYRPLVPGAFEPSHFEQLKNPNHWGSCGQCESHRKRDIDGQFALIADEFYYFGSCAPAIPVDYRPCIPKNMSPHGCENSAQQSDVFIRFIQQHYQPGIHCKPTQWEDAERKDSFCANRACSSLGKR